MKSGLLFLAVALLVLVGCTQLQPPAEQQSPLQGTEDEYGKRDNVLGQEYYSSDEGVGLADSDLSFEDFDEVAYQEVLKDIDVSAIEADCSKKPNQYEKDDCFYARAMSYNKQEFCSSIETVSVQRGCYRAIAVENSDVSVCQKMAFAPAVYNCIASVAVENVNDSFCSEIPANDEWRQKCLDLVQQEKTA